MFMRRVSESDRYTTQTALWSTQYGKWNYILTPDSYEFGLLYPGDFNGDGQADLVGANCRWDYTRLGIFLGPLASPAADAQMFSGGAFNEVIALDWDQDGRDDVVGASGGVTVLHADP
jgi:hypothetical protein